MRGRATPLRQPRVRRSSHSPQCARYNLFGAARSAAESPILPDCGASETAGHDVGGVSYQFIRIRNSQLLSRTYGSAGPVAWQIAGYTLRERHAPTAPHDSKALKSLG